MQLEYNHLVNGSYENHRISGYFKFENDFEKVNISFESSDNLSFIDAKNDALSLLLIIQDKISEAITGIENLKL